LSSPSPEDRVEQFIAAPDEVVNNPKEAEKLRDRKARDEARIARERASKLPGRPTLEDILADMVRVAEDASPEFRMIRRRRYELYGHYPIEYVLEHGTFHHLKQIAGLAETQGDQMLLRARTKKSLDEHDQRYIERYIRPHINKFPELQRETSGSRMGVFISDTHSLFMDPFYWESFLAFCEDAQPDVIGLVADHVDGSEISGHIQVPGFTTPLQTELDMFKAMVVEIRERIGYKTRIVLVGDNHFFDRMTRYLAQVSRALANLRTLKLDKLMDLDDLEIELAMGGSFISPDGQEDNRPFIRLWDRINMTHGTKLGKYPAAAELLSWGTSGVSGHVHRDQIIGGPVPALRREKWMSLGSGVIDEVAKYYIKGAGPAWTGAWGIAELMGRTTPQMTSVITTDGIAQAHGWVYKARPDLPRQGVETVREFWRERYGL
jgi:hypothetical protein